MTKPYKRKINIINNTRDSRSCNDIRKSLNSSERQSAKRSVEDTLLELENDVEHLRFCMEREQEIACDADRKISDALCYTLCKLGIRDRWGGAFETHTCECPDPWSLSDREIRDRYDI